VPVRQTTARTLSNILREFEAVLFWGLLERYAGLKREARGKEKEKDRPR
jgi:hypothetical protein